MSIEDEYKVMNLELEDDNDSEIEAEVESEVEKRSHVKCKSCRNCVLCCYKLLIKYNLFSNAYQVLTVAYKYVFL